MNTPDARSIASMTNDAGEYTMSSITGKLVLAAIREYDYAHAGEQEAIERVFAGLPRHADQRVLDVGCGIGGTAQYLCEQGWGQVVGVDIDANNIASARSRLSRPIPETAPKPIPSPSERRARRASPSSPPQTTSLEPSPRVVTRIVTATRP